MWFCFVWCHFWPPFTLENGRVYLTDWAIQRSDFLPCQSRIAKSLFPSEDFILKRLLLSSLWVNFPWCFSLYFSNHLGRNSIVALLPTAYLRRSLAHQGQGLKERATEDLYKALSIDPSNKRAKVNFICWLLTVKAFFMLLHHRLTFSYMSQYDGRLSPKCVKLNLFFLHFFILPRNLICWEQF